VSILFYCLAFTLSYTELGVMITSVAGVVLVLVPIFVAVLYNKFLTSSPAVFLFGLYRLHCNTLEHCPVYYPYDALEHVNTTMAIILRNKVVIATRHQSYYASHIQ